MFGTAAGTTPSPGTSSTTSQFSLFGAPMQDTIEAIKATIEIAARHGSATARLELHPEELGHISIRLLQTSEGLRARAWADTAAGAQALTQSRSELRQTLSSLGISLLHLDIGSSGQSPTGEHRNFAGAPNAAPFSATQASGVPTPQNEALPESINPQPTGPPLGEIVDVLA